MNEVVGVRFCRKDRLVAFGFACVLLLCATGGQAQLPVKGSDVSLRSPNLSSDRGCQRDCSGKLPRPVCGTDGRTYGTVCELQRVACQGFSIQVKHQGQCVASENRCWSERQRAEEVARTLAAIFVPQCTEDGRYSAVQCHAATGYCWCADPHGHPVRGSSVQNRRPSCRRAPYTASTNLRRGNTRKRPGKQGCNENDRSSFNKNLVKIFVSEFGRVSTAEASGGSKLTPNPVPESGAASEKRAVDWKFSELDKNGNQALDRGEIRALRRMVKKIVKPRECAKRFGKFCDQDRDRRISRDEWAFCLRVGSNQEQPEATGHEERQPPRREGDGMSKWNKQIQSFPVNEKGTGLAEEGRGPQSALRPPLARSSPVDPLDCQTERLNAQEQQHNSKHIIYIPECSPEGRYAQVQCYKSTGYCWCVNQDSGKPIPSTSVLNMRPDCVRLIKADRPIKDCPDTKRYKFAVDFVEYLVKEMSASQNQSVGTPLEVAPNAATVDTLARWKFDALDANDNKVLDRQEWRAFRKEMKIRKPVRKCGRNFVKFCDDNNDKRITFEEWSECFSVLKERSKENISRRRQKGQNPLDKYLKND